MLSTASRQGAAPQFGSSRAVGSSRAAGGRSRPQSAQAPFPARSSNLQGTRPPASAIPASQATQSRSQRAGPFDCCSDPGDAQRAAAEAAARQRPDQSMQSSMPAPEPPKPQRPGFSTPELISLTCLPWVMFVFTTSLFLAAYHAAPQVIAAFIFIGAAIACDQIRRSMVFGSSPLRYYLSVQCVVAFIFASAVGLFSYECCIETYWISNAMHAYANVLPSEAAVGYADASKIVFADEARLATGNTLGYKDIDVYCVVPILDDSGLDRVQFWAAGVNCCGARSDFQCDDAWDRRARSGLVILDRDWHPQYALAAKQAEAAFDIRSAEEPVFVRWVRDPEEFEKWYWRVGAYTILIFNALYLLFAGGVAWLINTNFRNTRSKSSLP